MSGLLSQEDLMRWTGFHRRKDLEAWLASNRIKYTYAKGNKLITTQSLIDSGISGLSSANDDQDAFFAEKKQTG